MAQRTQDRPAQACRHCRTAFVPVSKRQVFCSRRCQTTWRNNQNSPYGPGRKRCASCVQVKDILLDFPMGERLCYECLANRAEGRKLCTACGEVKAFDAFYAGNDRDGLAEQCRRCTLERARKRNAEAHVRERARARKLAEKYGLTLDDYQGMLVEQCFRCRICGRPHDPKGKQLVVDHCHATGVVRGLLCALCNSAIGYFEEDPTRMASAIAYLEGR